MAPQPCTSVWVNYKCGTASSVVLTKPDGSTFELRGRPMWHWLKESWLPSRAPVKIPRSACRCSQGFGRPADVEEVWRTAVSEVRRP